MANFPKRKERKKSWKETLIDRIRDGKVLPLISNAVNDRLIFAQHQQLVEKWAEYIEYPFDHKPSLTQMVQYQKIVDRADPDLEADDYNIAHTYLDFIKAWVEYEADDDLVEELQADTRYAKLPFSHIAERLERPSFSDPAENPLLLLADMPLPLYLTTGYHTFIETALTKAGKTPVTAFCRWHDGLHNIPLPDEGHVATAQAPLVYHLHGVDQYPESLVLTEDDHLDFLVAISSDPELIPKRVRHALADSALIMLGYSLRHWDFRTIFRTLIRQSKLNKRLTSVYLQLLDDENEKSYFENYFVSEAKFFKVEWNSTLNFLQEIHQGWQSNG